MNLSTTPARHWAVAVLLLAATWLSAADTITAIYPNTAVNAVPTTVVIIGTGFVATPTITIGGVALTSVTVDSATQITAIITPTAATGLKNITSSAGGSLNNGFTFVQSLTNAVEVRVTASIQSSLALAWTSNTHTTAGGALMTTGDTGFVAWSLLNLAAGATRHTNSTVGAPAPDVLDLEVINVGNAPTKVTISTAANSTQASGGISWARADIAGNNAFVMSVSDGMNTAGPIWLSLSTSRVINGNVAVAVGGTAAFDLQFKAPVWDSSAVNQQISVFATATGP